MLDLTLTPLTPQPQEREEEKEVVVPTHASKVPSTTTHEEPPVYRLPAASKFPDSVEVPDRAGQLLAF